MANIFETEDECRVEIAEQLFSQGMGVSIANEVAGVISPQCKREHEVTPALELRVGSWVVRDEDLPFFSVFSKGAMAVVAGLTSDNLIAPVTAAILAVADLAFNAWRKGGRLSPEQVRLLVELERSSNGLTADELRSRLSDESRIWTESETLAMLEELHAFVRVDRQTIALVEQGHDGRWRAIH